MTKISDLSFDLVEEILSRVGLTSLGAVRCTCKRWNALCKDQTFTKKHCALVNITSYSCDWTIGFSLLNIKSFLSIKEMGDMRCPLVEVWKVYQCDGLLLCVDGNHKLVLWNPYLAQTRWIKDKYYTLGLGFALGYDNNTNYKVLKISYRHESSEVVQLDIYDLKSDSWRILDTKSFRAWNRGVSLKGNTYFVERKKWERIEVDCVLCFDFTTERLGPPMHLPFITADEDDVCISCIRDEQLALFFQRYRVTYDIEIWITTKIEPNAASWTKLFKVDMKPLCGSGFQPKFIVRNFFIDKEKKLAVVFGACLERGDAYSTSYVVGEDGYYKEIGLEADVFYYVPSHVPLQ